MIKLIREGNYKLIETKGHTKILILDEDRYPWFSSKDIGEMIVKSFKIQKTNTVLANGKYRYYMVEDEDELVDLPHLELSLEDNSWQGYLLPKGLPENKGEKRRIIPTHEVITKRFNYLKVFSDSLNELLELK